MSSTSNADISEKLKVYLEINKKMMELRKLMTDYKKSSSNIESDIQDYMEKHNMDNILLKEGEIVKYERKVNQSFKKDSIVEKLTEKLKGDDKKAEELAESILSNKVFKLETKLKVNIKKQ